MPVTVQVSFADPQKINMVISKLGGWKPTAIRRLIEKATNEGERIAREAAYPHESMDTGRTASQIKGLVVSDMMGMVYSNQQGVLAIEYGRKPGGKMPPVKILEEWAVRHGFPAGLGYVIARGIAANGTEGLHMFQKAVEYMTENMGKWADEAAEEIEDELKV